MSIKKHTPIFIILGLLASSGFGFPVVYAEVTDQAGTVTLLPAETIITREPEGFNFPVSFIPSTGILPVYALLNPTVIEQTLQVFDSNDASGFSVTAAMTHLRSTGTGNNLIHFTDLSLVTLSQSPDGTDSGPYNEPPGSPNVSTPSNCPWNPSDTDIATQCDSYMTSFSYPSGSTLTANDLEITNTEVDVLDGSVFNSPLPGETLEALIDYDVINYSGVTGNTLTGLTGIDIPHLSGSQIRQHWEESNQVTILQNNTIADRGSFSIGFGFRLSIRPEMKQDQYSGTLIFTLIPL